MMPCTGKEVCAQEMYAPNKRCAPNNQSPQYATIIFMHSRPSLVPSHFRRQYLMAAKYPAVVAYCKRPNVGDGNGLATDTLH